MPDLHKLQSSWVSLHKPLHSLISAAVPKYTSIVSSSMIWPIQLSHNTIGTHNGLVVQDMRALVSREVGLLIPFWAENWACCAISEGPAVTERCSLALDCLRKLFHSLGSEPRMVVHVTQKLSKHLYNVAEHVACDARHNGRVTAKEGLHVAPPVRVCESP